MSLPTKTKKKGMDDDKWTVEVEAGEQLVSVLNRLKKSFADLPLRVKHVYAFWLEAGEQRSLQDVLQQNAACSEFNLVNSDASVRLLDGGQGRSWNAYELARLRFKLDPARAQHRLSVCNDDAKNKARVCLSIYGADT